MSSDNLDAAELNGARPGADVPLFEEPVPLEGLAAPTAKRPAVGAEDAAAEVSDAATGDPAAAEAGAAGGADPAGPEAGAPAPAAAEGEALDPPGPEGGAPEPAGPEGEAPEPAGPEGGAPEPAGPEAGAPDPVAAGVMLAAIGVVMVATRLLEHSVQDTVVTVKP